MKRKIAICGGGIGGTLLSTQLKDQGYDVTVCTEGNLFAEGETAHPTELHLGFEYIGSSNLDGLASAKACLEGNIAFLDLFGPNGLEILQTLGVLEKERTTFEITQDTDTHTKLTLASLVEPIEKLKQYYKEITADNPNRRAKIPVETLIQPLDPAKEMMEKRRIKGGYEVAQWGINISRFAAIIKQIMIEKGIIIREDCKVAQIIENRLVSSRGEDLGDFDIIILANNTGMLELISNSQLDIPEELQNLTVNQRMEVFVQCNMANLSEAEEKMMHPRYTLAKAERRDLTKNKELPFDGTMMDLVSVDDNKVATIALYAAGPPDHDVVGGGCWGRTGEKADASGKFVDMQRWKQRDWQKDPEVYKMVLKTIASVQKWNPLLEKCELKIQSVSLAAATTVNNFSAVREKIPPFQVSESIFGIICTKLTHAALNARTLTDTISRRHKAETTLANTPQQQPLQIPHRYLTNPSQLTRDAQIMARSMGLPPEAGFPKKGGVDIRMLHEAITQDERHARHGFARL